MSTKKLITAGIAFIAIALFVLANAKTTLAAPPAANPPTCTWPALDQTAWQQCLDDVADAATKQAVADYIATHPVTGTLPSPVAPYSGTLTYDRSNNKTLALNQTKYIADYINEMVFAKGTNAVEADVVAAIQATQQEAQNVGAEVHQGQTLELPSDRAWLVWSSNGDEVVTRPSDVSDVFGTNVNAKGKVWIQVVFDPNVHPRVLKKWQSSGNLWAVALW